MFDTGTSAETGAPRREFLKTGVAVSLGVVAGSFGNEASTQQPAAQTLPQVPLGRYSISRLIVGGNPIEGFSHLSTFITKAMLEYYTPERIQWLLKHCQECGINTWQSSRGSIDHYRRYRDSGGNMHYLALESDPGRIKELADKGAIGIAHHGGVTDSMYREGKIDRVQDFLKRVRDAGVLVGLSSHMPEVTAYVEEKGWDVDYYMTCFYYPNRSREELRKLLGEAPLPPGEVYLEGDPARMCQVIRQVKKPCLGFKILAAGRSCENAQDVENAFKFAFENIKPTDAVIVGMWPRYSDQVAQNAELTRKYG